MRKFIDKFLEDDYANQDTETLRQMAEFVHKFKQSDEYYLLDQLSDNLVNGSVNNTNALLIRGGFSSDEGSAFANQIVGIKKVLNSLIGIERAYTSRLEEEKAQIEQAKEEAKFDKNTKYGKSFDVDTGSSSLIG